MSELSDIPRVLEYVTVKRNLPLTWRSYGHWWVELDGTESYGWWPAKAAGIVRLVRGSDGVLNGGASRTVDPNHGLPGDHEFHPVLTRHRSDDEVRASIRSFAQSFAGGWRWSTRPSMNCRLFQLALFDAIGIVDGTGNYRTRGGGCPALAAGRRIEGRITGRRRWPRNLPQPGVRVADLELVVRREAPPASVRSATA
ncbi:hypothetical protein [Iamia sp.]|uniref:hypothetical protein n=1 Tax=Iamia sp. TaxID=2722710 RepID=UPI002B7E007F|nr:hypothetical protein [Iamia sp.]HXH56545.1 hypothetical protein [Iamia sp.]